MTRRRTIWISIAVALLFVIIVGAYNRTKLPQGVTFVDYSSGACWSKDGRALFYVGQHRDGNRLCRYDVRSRKIHVYNIPEDMAKNFCDVSPDEKQIISGDESNLFLVDLYTGKCRIIQSTTERKYLPPWKQDSIGYVTWLPHGSILFAEGTSDLRNAYLLNLNNNTKKRLSTVHVFEIYPSVNSTSFLYWNKDQRYHLLDIRNGKDKMLETSRLKQHRTFTFIYLSERLLVYTFNTPDPVFEMLDLKTMKTKRIRMNDLEMYRDGDISPQLTSQWFSGPLHQDTTPVELCLEDIPKKTIKQLKSVEFRR